MLELLVLPRLFRRRRSFRSSRFHPYAPITPSSVAQPNVVAAVPTPQSPMPNVNESSLVSFEAPASHAKRTAITTPVTANASLKRRSSIQSPAGPGARRVSFGRTVLTVIEHEGIRCISETEQETRASDCGKYYPASPAQQLHGGVLEKRWPKKHKAPDAFCGCNDGCLSASCPCAKEGIGCWWEDWGCGCQGACKSGVPAHVYDCVAVTKARRATIRKATRNSHGGKARRSSQ